MYKGTIQALIKEQAIERTINNKFQKYKTEANKIKQSNSQPSQCNKDVRSQSFIFYLKAKNIQNAQTIKKSSKQLLKKFMLTQNQPQIENPSGSSAKQEYNLNNKRQKDQKQFKKTKSNSSNKRIQILQTKMMKLTEILGLQKKAKNKLTNSNMRKSQSNFKNKEENLLGFSYDGQPNHKNSIKSVSLNLNQQMNKETHFQSMKFSSGKMTFKQLIKAQKCPNFQQNANKCLEPHLLKRTKVTFQQMQRQRNYNKSKARLFFQQQVQNIATNTRSQCKSKIKSHTKQTQELLENFSSSIVYIKRFNIVEKRDTFRNKLIDSHSSYKSNLLNPKSIVFKSKSVILKPQLLHREKAQLALSLPKQIKGWEDTNGFSEGQSFCELLQ